MKKTLLTVIISLCFAISSFAQSGTTGPLTWSLSGGTLIISGTGAMPDYTTSSPTQAPWYAYRSP